MDSNAVDRDLALVLLEKAVAEHPDGKAGVAKQLGCGRSLISRVLSPNDPLKISAALARRVIDRLHVIPSCPATQRPKPRTECQSMAFIPAPTHNPSTMQIWKTCQTCPHRPTTPKERFHEKSR